MKEQKKCVPEIRFAGFTDDWEQRKLGEVGYCQSGIGFPEREQGRKKGIPFYKVSDMTLIGNELIMVTSNNYVSEEQILKNRWKVINSIPAIIFAKVGAALLLDRKRLVLNSFLIDNNTMAYILNEKWDYYFCKTLFDTIYLPQLSQVGALPSFNGKDVENLNVIIPKSKEEQTAIGNFFKQLDETIALHQRTLEKYQKLKISYLEKMFPKENEQFPELRFPNFTDAWEQRKLGELVEFFSGLTYSPQDITDETGVLVLRSSNVQDNRISSADNVYVAHKVVNVKNVQVGDIIVVVRNGSRNLIGKHALINNEMKNTVIGAFMTGIRSSNSLFINALLNTPKFISEIEKNLGATINQITIGAFKLMEFKVPTQEEQIAIGNFFKQLDDTIALHQREVEKYKKIKQAYLEKMFI